MIDFVIELAKNYYSKLIFVHVDQQEDLEEESKQKLKDKVDALEYSMIDYHEVVHDDLVEGLLNFIKEHDGDWLAMTTHTTSIFDKLFHSSLTTKMLRNSPVPLLIFNQFKSDIIVL
jgi:nucleotide-binding universal stress UspA family protein